MLKFVIVVLRLTGLTTLQIIEKAQFIVLCMTGNTFFPTPSPVLSVIIAAIKSLNDAELEVLKGTPGAVKTRNAQLLVLKGLLEQLRQYVQNIANLTPDLGEAIPYTAGMEIKLPGGRKPQVFGAKNWILPGMVEITSVSIPGGYYNWFMTETPLDDSSWSRIGGTHQARFIKTGLTSGKKYYFKIVYSGTNNLDFKSPVLDVTVL